MRRFLPALVALLAVTAGARAHGLLIPEEKTVPPLAMLSHKVGITVNDQVAVTKVEQVFRNHTSRPLEATYVFPVPKGATVNKFSMMVDGKDVKGELVEADKAREIYSSIVRRTQDPGLLEYLGNNLFRMRVFPIPPNGDQKVTLSYTSVADRENGLVEYVYPLKTDGKATATLETFSIVATIDSQHGVQNVYSPTHGISLKREGDKKVHVTFDKDQALLDKDFQMFYQLGDKDVGLTALCHKPVAKEAGYALLLLTPKVDIAKQYQVPRDMVFVLDTSGSMRGAKMEQGRKALKYCLDNLDKSDRFALINFATTVNKYRDSLTEVDADRITQAKKWVDDLDATGGTAIHDALSQALELRPKDEGRTFTVVFFTDGQPTIGETNPETILKNTLAKNSANTRIFTFGVGDDVNATMLDQLAEKTRALATYVRPQEDIENKTSGLFAKISHPILANLKLTTTADVRLSEVYPAQLPDLFHGTQLTVLARYTGKGPSAIKLTGNVGKETKEFVYELTFAEKTGDEKDFVEHLWARRKVGYMLDQIRANGQKKELIEEVVMLAKKYGITTPYTSYLIVPDGVAPVVALDPTSGKPRPTVPPGGGFGFQGGGGFNGFQGGSGVGGFGVFGGTPGGLAPKTPDSKPTPVSDFARKAGEKGDVGKSREEIEAETLGKAPADGKDAKNDRERLLSEARMKKENYDKARDLLQKFERDGVQAGKLGVDLSVQMANLRGQSRLDRTAQRRIQGRDLLEVGGVWIDEQFDAKTPTLVVKSQSNAYFKLLEKQPDLKDVLRLGNHLVWIAPSGTALVIDASNGKEDLTDKEIEALFAAKK